MSKENLQKYPYIVADGKKWGSDLSYIERLCYEADKANAPRNSIWYDDTKKVWITTNEVPKELVSQLDDYISGKRGGYLL